MRAGYRLTPGAAEGFRRIAFYAADRFGPEVAERVVAELELAFESSQQARVSDIAERTQ